MNYERILKDNRSGLDKRVKSSMNKEIKEESEVDKITKNELGRWIRNG